MTQRTNGIDVEQLFDRSREAIVVASRDGVVLCANAAAERLLGFARGEVVGQRLDSILPDEAINAHAVRGSPSPEPAEPCRAGASARVVARRKDRSEVDVELRLSEIASADRDPVLVAWLVGAAERPGVIRGGDDDDGAALLDGIERMAAALSAALTLRDIADATVNDTAELGDADLCTLHLLEGDPAKVTFFGVSRGATQRVIATHDLDAPDEHSSTVRALMEREPFDADAEAGRAAFFPPALLGAGGRRAKTFWSSPLVSDRRAFGVLAVGFYEEKPLSAGIRSVVRTAARQCAFALERARLRREATANEQRLRFLADASTQLAVSLDYETTFTTVTRLAVPTIADWAAVDLVEKDGTFVRLAAAHVDPVKTALARDLWHRWPARSDDTTGLANVIRTGASELVSHLGDAALTAIVHDPERLEKVRQFGLTSQMCVPLKVREKTIGAITLGSSESGRRFDSTDLTLAEDLAVRASIAIENATSFREADEANRMKDEFLATMSHELRTPLGAILGWASLLQGDQRDDVEAIQEGLAAIERNARAQVKLIEDVLDVSRIITGKLRIEARPIDIGAIVTAAMDVVRPMAAAKGVTLSGLIEPEPMPAFGDPDRIQQIVWNLLSNGVKFTPKGGSVEIEVARKDGTIRVRVTDTGEGIKPQFLPFVFERFRQADGSTTRRHAGLGLGLAIARHLVELHGGAIRVASAGPGLGTAFTVTLPMRTAHVRAFEDEAPSKPVVAPQPPSTPPSLESLRVLVCDDDPETRTILVRMLEGAGAKVSVASSAFEALEQLGPFAPHVIVSDVGMPAVDGYSFIRKVRTLPEARGGRTPAIALTAYTRPDDVARALASGFQMHVAKPAEPGDLVERVAKLASRVGGALPSLGTARLKPWLATEAGGILALATDCLHPAERCAAKPPAPLARSPHGAASRGAPRRSLVGVLRLGIVVAVSVGPNGDVESHGGQWCSARTFERPDRAKSDPTYGDSCPGDKQTSSEQACESRPDATCVGDRGIPRPAWSRSGSPTGSIRRTLYVRRRSPATPST